ncbi:hypothetical protein [Catalinimonas niigatensis]|uniref:hypothetical protein n=1 Tax=Catalinimonas niigatensis TaxID=1397264 RepID=UPI0026651A4F|nr:hypothetical protein [Catalinimonas niigatensis]WPP51498.1 hypothetical protein PZB72_03730 [Catalinimonas niigatensis]
MEPTNYKKQTHWKARLDEWRTGAIEQQRFHESVSSYLKKVYDKTAIKRRGCTIWKD